MNFIQRNPSDPKHQEFHDGEYEYWPMDDSIKTKSISIPAALVSGLELLAAAAAAGLLAVALMALYVLSSPLAISENSAVINTNIYNNQNDQDVVYTLSFLETPDNVLQDGILLHDEQTLSLQNLSGGTTYLLKYYDSEQNEVGQFRFTTPGEKQELEAPEPFVPDQPPEDPIGGMEEPTPEMEVPAEPGDETTESTTEPSVPDERPPVIVHPRPTPRPEPEEEEDHTPDPEPEPTPVPEAAPGDPEIEGFISNQYISGVFDINDLGYTEYFVFINIPNEEYDFTINRTGPGDYVAEHEYIDGTLTISITSALDHGSKITTEVTVETSAGTVSKKSILTPPSLTNAALSVVKNSNGTYTFNITATATINDDTDGIGKMILNAALTPYLYAETSNLSMTQDPNDPTRYYATTGPITIPAMATKTASVSVTGHWDRLGEDVFPQSKADNQDY